MIFISESFNTLFKHSKPIHSYFVQKKFLTLVLKMSNVYYIKTKKTKTNSIDSYLRLKSPLTSHKFEFIKPYLILKLMYI